MILDRFNEVSAKFAEEMTDEEMNTLLAEQAELQEKIDAANAWDLDRCGNSNGRVAFTSK